MFNVRCSMFIVQCYIPRSVLPLAVSLVLPLAIIAGKTNPAKIAGSNVFKNKRY